MKKVIFIFLLFIKIIFPQCGGGELYFEFFYTNYFFDISIQSNGYCWKWNEDNEVERISNFSYQSPTRLQCWSYAAPKSTTSTQRIPWGSYNVSMTVYDNNGYYKTSVNFILDLRDENWSHTGDGEYVGVDTYFKYDSGNNVILFQADQNGFFKSETVTNNKICKIWEIWTSGPTPMTPKQDNFTIPVVLKNRRDGSSAGFGSIKANSSSYPSDAQALLFDELEGEKYNNVIEAETKQTGQYYNFKWIPENVNNSGNGTIYNELIDIQTGRNIANRTLTRNFRLAYPLTVKNYLGETNINTGEIYFKDPTTDNQLHSVTQNGNYTKSETFADLHISVGDDLDQKYALKAVPVISYSGHNYYWYSGDFNPTTQTDILVGGETNLTANYKGSQLSNNPSAYSRNGQHKYIWTSGGTNGWLHMVYESMGRIWYEYSSNGGSSWIIGNNGQPLDNGEGKCPSIATTNYNGYNFIGIVWQEKNGSHYRIRATIVNQYGAAPIFDGDIMTLYNEPSDTYDGVNANPNLIMAPGIGAGYVVLFERKSSYTSSGINYLPGVNWIAGRITENGSVDDHFTIASLENSFGVLSATDASSTNVSVALYEASSNASLMVVQLLCQDHPWAGNPIYKIKETYLGFSSTNSELTSWECIQLETNYLSSASPTNYSPAVMTKSNDTYLACWIGNLTGNEDASWPEVDELVYYNSATPSVRKYYGSGVQCCAISPTDPNHNEYSYQNDFNFFAWSQNVNGSWSNRVGTIYPNNYISPYNINTTGKYIQLCKAGAQNMKVSSFSSVNAPYHFNVSSTSFDYFIVKASKPIIGRGCLINKDEASFSYRFEDLNVDGKDIAFVDSPDSLDYNDLSILNKALLTESFDIEANSNIIFSERIGFADSTGAVKILGKEGYISYRLELIDESTEKVLGTVRQSKITSDDLVSFNIKAYKLNTEAVDKKTVRARIVIETNIEDRKTILTKSFAEENETLKKESALTELSIEGLEAVTNYNLEQNYPNPFNPSTMIRYQLPMNSEVRLKVFDILGKEVATLVNKTQNAGRYEVRFDASSLSSGVYIYRLQAGEYTATHKMLMIK